MQYEIYRTYFIQKVEGTENKTVPTQKVGGHVPPSPGICTHDHMLIGRQKACYWPTLRSQWQLTPR